MKYYAGIGSRETPQEILSLMTKIATKLQKDGFTLRSGGAHGADTAFSRGCKDKQRSKNLSKFTDKENQALESYKNSKPIWLQW